MNEYFPSSPFNKERFYNYDPCLADRLRACNSVLSDSDYKASSPVSQAT